MKKKIFYSVLSFVIALSGFGLVACGDDTGSINPYEQYVDTIAEFKEATTLFKEGATSGGIETDFYLNNFNTMTNEGDKIEGNKNYITLVGYGMNYIEKYYVYLSDLENKDYSSLHSCLDDLVSSFDVINQDSKNMVNAEGIAHIPTYNHYFYEYEAHTKNFINEVYNTALTLSDFLISQANFIEELGTDTQTDVQIEFYTDSQILNIFDDIRRLLIISAEGVDYQADSYDGQAIELYDDTVILLTNYATLSTHYTQELTAEVVTEAMELGDLLANERATTRKALSRFSIYDFEDLYELSIDLYAHENQDAVSQYSQLQKYFSAENNYLTQYYQFLSQNIYE